MDFIGVGAQKSGTSWIYACLYEHPQICAPIKEIHFFSRKKYKDGIDRYLDKFSACPANTLKGEFSTSYLYDKRSAEKIHKHFPNVKIIMSLRDPTERAFSQYRNAIRAGEISKDSSFKKILEKDPSIIEQGMYYEQVKRYIDMFGKDQVLVLVYEDSKKDPAAFIKKIYEFLKVDTSFVPSMLHKKVNIARTPRFVIWDRTMIHIAEFLRRIGFDKIVWIIKKSDVPDRLRKVNTQQSEIFISLEEKQMLKKIFRNDVAQLSALLDQNLLQEWKMK